MVAQRTSELESAVASIEQTLADQRHFIAMLSHEVRSPLAVIHSAGQLLTLRSKGVPAQQALAQRILRGSARLSYFFDNCLTQDRIDSHNFEGSHDLVTAGHARRTQFMARWLAADCGGMLPAPLAGLDEP